MFSLENDVSTSKLVDGTVKFKFKPALLFFNISIKLTHPG